MVPIKVGLVDDDVMLRTSLAETMMRCEEISVLFAVSEGKVLFEKLAIERPDVLLVDIIMTDMNGIEIVEKVRNSYPKIKIIMISGVDDSSIVLSLIQLGISGYLHKAFGVIEVITAAQTCLNGDYYFSQNILNLIITEIKTNEHISSQLTDREMEILRFLADGKTVKEISYELGMMQKTAENHKYNIMKKLNLNNQAELTKYAIRRGLIKP